MEHYRREPRTRSLAKLPAQVTLVTAKEHHTSSCAAWSRCYLHLTQPQVVETANALSRRQGPDAA